MWKLTKRKNMFWLGILAVLFAGCGGAWYFLCIPKRSVENIRSEVSAYLPLGSRREEILKWLDSQSIEYRDIRSLQERREIGIYASISERSCLQDDTEIQIFL